MEKLLKLFKEKAQDCKLNTKESRARKGAYVDCIVELEKAMNNSPINKTRKVLTFEEYVHLFYYTYLGNNHKNKKTNKFCSENDIMKKYQKYCMDF